MLARSLGNAYSEPAHTHRLAALAPSKWLAGDELLLIVGQPRFTRLPTMSHAATVGSSLRLKFGTQGAAEQGAVIGGRRGPLITPWATRPTDSLLIALEGELRPSQAERPVAPHCRRSAARCALTLCSDRRPAHSCRAPPQQHKPHRHKNKCYVANPSSLIYHLQRRFAPPTAPDVGGVQDRFDVSAIS